MSSLKCFPFHTIMKVKVWMFWNWNHILSLVWQFSFPLWKWKFGSFERQVVFGPCFLCDSFPFHTIVKIKVWNLSKFERKVVITPFVFCDMSSFPYHYESESLNVLKDKLLLHLVSCVTFPFHTIVRVNSWNFWKTNCDYTMCLLWHVFLSKPWWKWKFHIF